MGKDDGEARRKETAIRMEETEVPHETVDGESFCRGFTAGGKFKLVKHRSPAEEGKLYAILGVDHSASLGGAYVTGGNAATEYHNHFNCVPLDTRFRPARSTPKPVVHGVQTAVVTGPAGQEIHVDKYGRVKVQFHWDRYGKKDDKSSCWVRVSQAWTGKGWGHIANPHISEEVIVAFLEGDPDRPIIVGRVYNADHMPPYPLPEGAAIIGMKSASTKSTSIYSVASKIQPT
jgi:type VI secretion system secreted protein VgrG